MSSLCEVCKKKAFYICSKCEHSFYCSKQHQIQHWRTSHKNGCIKFESNTDKLLAELLKQRYIVRKQFYQNYSNKIFEVCLIDAKVMVDYDRRIKDVTKDLFDDFQYAASVCLLCRMFYLLGDKINARILLQNYLSEGQQLLANLSLIPDANNNPQSRQKEIFQRKMNLISTIANLCYVLQLECVKYYVLYTKHIEKAFGNTSTQASNCYFQLGCYFAQQGSMKKAIAFFLKSADCRQPQYTGDCYFNIGILYRLQGYKTHALQMFQKALKFRTEQHGDISMKIAEVLENIGMIYTEVNDFVTAMFQYQKALKIRLSTCQHSEISQSYKKTIYLIQQLYEKLCLYLYVEQDQMKKPPTFYHLKQKIQNDRTFWGNRLDKLQQISSKNNTKTLIQASTETEKAKKAVSIQKTKKQQKKKNQLNLFISDQLSSKLSSLQLYHLADLQLELSTAKYKSDFSSTHIIGKSIFLQKLAEENLEILQRDNQTLFKLIRIQEIFKNQKKWDQKSQQLAEPLQFLKKNKD